MEASEQDGEPAHKPFKLSMEELKILKECRYNSIVRRGLPIGIISLGIATQVVKRGYFQRWSGLFYAGVFCTTSLVGIGSYGETCRMKLMALENSQLGEIMRRKKLGLPIPRERIPEFSDGTSKLDEPSDPLESKLESSWKGLREKSRSAQTPPTNEKGGGISYDELRRMNRSNQGDYKSLTPGEEEDMENRNKHLSSSEMATFKAKSFNDDKSSALDFSESDKPRSSALDFSGSDKIRNNGSLESAVKTRSNKEGVPKKNKYGDEIV